jgi:MFS family permease
MTLDIDKGDAAGKLQGAGRGLFAGIARNVLILGLVSMFTDVSSQMIFPLVPLYLTSVLGAGATAVGVVEGAAETTASFLKVFSGYWSDRISRRKPFVLLGYSLSTVIKPLFALANAWGLVLLFRAVERIGKGVRDAPRDAIVAESSAVRVRGKSYGLNRALDGLGSVAGAVLAFVLLPILDFKPVFLYATIPAMISVLFVFMVKEGRSPPRDSARKRGDSMTVSLRALPNNLRLLILATSVFAMGNFGYAFMLLRARNVGLPNETAILLYVLFYAVYVLWAIPAGMLSDRLGRKPLLIGGYAMFAVTAIGLIFASSLASLIPFFIVFGLAFATFDGVQRAYVVDFAPPELKATTLGTFHTAVGVVALPGGLIAGLLWDKIGPQATFVYGLVLTAVALAILLTVKKSAPAVPQETNP